MDSIGSQISTTHLGNAYADAAQQAGDKKDPNNVYLKPNENGDGFDIVSWNRSNAKSAGKSADKTMETLTNIMNGDFKNKGFKDSDIANTMTKQMADNFYEGASVSKANSFLTLAQLAKLAQAEVTDLKNGVQQAQNNNDGNVLYEMPSNQAAKNANNNAVMNNMILLNPNDAGWKDAVDHINQQYTQLAQIADQQKDIENVQKKLDLYDAHSEVSTEYSVSDDGDSVSQVNIKIGGQDQIDDNASIKSDDTYNSNDSDPLYPYKYAVQKETSFYGLPDDNNVTNQGQQNNQQVQDQGEQDNVSVASSNSEGVKKDQNEIDDNASVNSDDTYNSNDSDPLYPYKYAVQKETSFYGLPDENDQNVTPNGEEPNNGVAGEADNGPDVVAQPFVPNQQAAENIADQNQAIDDNASVDSDDTYNSNDSDPLYPYKYAVQKETSFYGLPEDQPVITDDGNDFQDEGGELPDIPKG